MENNLYKCWVSHGLVSLPEGTCDLDYQHTTEVLTPYIRSFASELIATSLIFLSYSTKRKCVSRGLDLPTGSVLGPRSYLVS